MIKRAGTFFLVKVLESGKIESGGNDANQQFSLPPCSAPKEKAEKVVVEPTRQHWGCGGGGWWFLLLCFGYSYFKADMLCV